MILKEDPTRYPEVSESYIKAALKEEGLESKLKVTREIAFMSKKALKDLYKLVGRNAFLEYFRRMRIYTDFEGYEYFKKIEKQED